MGLALSRSEDVHRLEVEPDRAAEEQRIAGLAYLAWPIAVIDRVAPREPASHWYRGQMRQALWFGLASLGVALVALLWPLLLSALIPYSTAIIAFYAVALLVDLSLLVVWLLRALGYSRRAARGEWFEIPWLLRVTGGGTPPA